jgi:hypothetical protein
MRRILLPALALIASTTPARAEKLEFDHRLYPPLQEVLDSGDKDMLLFDDRNPARLVDLIAIRGKSAKNWTEALEIVALVRPRDVSTAKDWFEIIRTTANRRCPNTISIIAEDAVSVTFQRLSPNCPAERAETGLYRLVAGQRSWFQLAVLVKGEMDETSRGQWLALLASAHLD